MQDFVARKLNGKELFGHPAGLYVLFMTEMWERFSYYGMRSLLIMYMTYYLFAEPARAHEVLGYNSLHGILVSIFGEMTVQQFSSQMYGLYTGFVYFTPFFGGMLADKYLGKHRSVYIGASLMAIGHFLMASERLFLPALLFIILGYGFFKPNLSTQVGNLYKSDDQRMDAAFSIYYMGVNLGAMLSPFICGTLGQKIGWHYGFGAAGIGMLICMVGYWAGSPLIPKTEERTYEQKVKEKRPLTKQEWNAVISLVVLCILNILFWTIYEQQGNTLQLWADQKTDWMVLGWEMPSSWFQAFNPIIILAISPVLIMFWKWQNRRGKEPSSVMKMGIGCILCGLAYVIMIFAARAMPGAEKGTVMWLLGTTFLFTIGEIYLSPIGLSLVVQVAPRPIISAMMGLWYMSSFFGNWGSGQLGMYYDSMSKENFFALCCALGIAAGVAFFVVRKPIDKAIGKAA